jgi:hypothetical protein
VVPVLVMLVMVVVVVVVAATPVAAAVPALVMVQVMVPVMVVAADVAHARTRATHKAAKAVSPHKLATRMPSPHVSSKHGPNMTTTPSPPAMCRPAFRLQANRPAATVVVFVAVAPLAAAVVDHVRVVAAVAAITARQTAVKPALSATSWEPGFLGLLSP